MEIDRSPIASTIPGRPDGRKKEQIRPPMAELGPLNRADGSARFAQVSYVDGKGRMMMMDRSEGMCCIYIQGQTCVLAAIHGPGIPRYSRKEKIEGATIEVSKVYFSVLPYTYLPYLPTYIHIHIGHTASP